MATYAEVMAARLDTELLLLKAAADAAGHGGTSEAMARAALILAEAYAWVQVPGQPHGANISAGS